MNSMKEIQYEDIFSVDGIIDSEKLINILNNIINLTQVDDKIVLVSVDTHKYDKRTIYKLSEDIRSELKDNTLIIYDSDKVNVDVFPPSKVINVDGTLVKLQDVIDYVNKIKEGN